MPLLSGTTMYKGAGITVKNDHNPLVWFLNGKNANNKVKRWSLELATYNITFEWIQKLGTKQLIVSHG